VSEGSNDTSHALKCLLFSDRFLDKSGDEAGRKTTAGLANHLQRRRSGHSGVTLWCALWSDRSQGHGRAVSTWMKSELWLSQTTTVVTHIVAEASHGTTAIVINVDEPVLSSQQGSRPSLAVLGRTILTGSHTHRQTHTQLNRQTKMPERKMRRSEKCRLSICIWNLMYLASSILKIWFGPQNLKTMEPQNLKWARWLSPRPFQGVRVIHQGYWI